MNRTLLSFTVVCALACGTPFVMADVTSPRVQTASHGGGHGGMQRLQAALNQLNLSTSQKNSINTIILQTRSKLRALRSSTNETTRKQQAKQIIQSARRSIGMVLTAAQRTQLRSILLADRSQQKA